MLKKILKQLYSNDDNKGYIAVQTIIIICIIIVVCVIAIIQFNDKLIGNRDTMEEGINAINDYENINSLIRVYQSSGPIIEDDNETDLLVTDNNDTRELTNVKFNLEKRLDKDNEFTITLANFDGFENFKVSNNGTLEIVNIDGDDITLRIVGGQPVDYVVLDGEYKQSEIKFVTAQNSPDYNVDGFSGTLESYLHEYEPAGLKEIIYIYKSPTNNQFPETYIYNENGSTVTLRKAGSITSSVVNGSEAKTKFVTGQDSANYQEVVSDNGITTNYVGTLNLYVDKGSNSSTINKTITITNQVNDFKDYLLHQEDINDNNVPIIVSGVLNKTGSVKKNVVKGSDTTTKEVTNQETSDYHEIVMDNGVQTNYTGTLTQYVVKGSDARLDRITIIKLSEENEFDEIINYTQTIDDNGVQTNHVGILRKYGDSYSELIKGSVTHSKFVTNQNTPNYVETIHDNGVETTYSGTLIPYVVSGLPEDRKVVIDNVTNKNNHFEDTIPYDDGEYSGTLTKTGNVVSTWISGLPSDRKYIVGYTAPYYNENGYEGYLNPYVVYGQAPLTKVVKQKSNSYYNDFPETIPYNDSSYIGTLTKSGDVIVELIGPEPISKFVTGQTSPYYNDGTYSGLLTQYIDSGTPADYRTETATCSNYQTGYYDNNGRFVLTGQGEDCPETYAYSDGIYSGALNRIRTEGKGCSYSGTPYTTCSAYFIAYYEGYVVKPDTRVYRYEGTVWTADTRYNYYTQHYSGTVSTEDTRVYRYEGYVERPDTRVYEYTQTYTGEVVKPDTRVYKYEGNVTKPDTRVYGYAQKYMGLVEKPDTRIYKYQGTVTKPDTRIYEYSQDYTGTIQKPDTRIYKYQGNVTKPDTRVYEYHQMYVGLLYKPEIAIYKYQGNVIKPGLDTRVIDYYYQYDVEINYYKK